MTEDELIRLLDTKMKCMQKLEDLLGVEEMNIVYDLVSAQKKIDRITEGQSVNKEVSNGKKN